MNHWLDAMLKRWSFWYVARFKDKSMGYASESPIVRFGTVGGSGRVWDGIQISTTNEESERVHSIMTNHLSPFEYNLMVVYYVNTGCSYRATGKKVKLTHPTVKTHVELVASKIEKLLDKKD